MNVLQINKLYFPWIGGVEKHVQDLSEALIQDPGIDLTVLVASEGSQTGQFFIHNVNVLKTTNIFFRLFKRTLLFSTPLNLSLLYWIRKIKADILHFHLPNPWAVLVYWLVRPAGKVVVTWHSDIVKQKKMLWFYRPLERWFLSRVDAILVTSPNMIRYSLQLKGFESRCHVVPLGIDGGKYAELPDISLAPLKRKQLLFVGRLVYYKGVRYLIEAMTQIDADLLIIGEGVLFEELTALIASRQLEGKVKIIPPVTEEQLFHYFMTCDLFVLPSVATSEAFGIVQLEAMACGKAVVSTNLPTGVPFVNEHGKTGLVVEPAHVGGLVGAINTLLQDDALREQMGMYARARVLGGFTNDRVAAKVNGIYQQLLKGNNDSIQLMGHSI